MLRGENKNGLVLWLVELVLCKQNTNNLGNN
jgi:hypothetical protein